MSDIRKLIAEVQDELTRMPAQEQSTPLFKAVQRLAIAVKVLANRPS